jgi:hypothetical protein
MVENEIIKLKNVRKVTFTAYVHEDELSMVEAELNSLYQRSEATLAAGYIGNTAVRSRNKTAVDVVTFFNDLRA